MTHVDGGGVSAGTQLNGIYEIDKRVAMGGMGEVYIGHVIQTGDKVAIKMILPEHANNDLILDLFRKEASTLHNLYHEAIVRYYVFSVDPTLNRPYLAMEFADGPALGDRVRSYPLNEGEMSVLLPRIAGGLHAAHKAGIVHRDLSPDNIILVGNDVNRAKIIDFGIAKSTSSGEGTLIGSGFAGKLKYVSPEQLGLGNGDVSALSDIYSLGLVFAEAVIGQPLDMGGSQVEVIDKRRAVPDLSTVPEYIRPLINWMLQPDPAMRPPTMEAVANWTPATPTPVTMAPAWGGAPAADATQIAPGGFAPGGPQQGASYPPQGGSYPPHQPTGYPPQQTGYPPQQTGYPPQQTSYPPQQADSIPPQQSGAAPHPRDAAPATARSEPKRRRGGPLKFLSILFSGAVVAGGIAAFVVMQQPNDSGGGKTGDPKIADGDGTKVADGKTDGSAKTGGSGDGDAASGGDKTTDGSIGGGDPSAPKTPETPMLAGGGDAGGDTDSGVTGSTGGDSGVKTDGGVTGLAGGGKIEGDNTKPRDEDTDAKTSDTTTGTPTVADGGSTGLKTPKTDGDNSAIATDGGDSTTTGDGGLATLGGGGDTKDSALTKDPVTDGGKDPAGDLKEPTITTKVPGEITPGGGDTDVAGLSTDGGSDSAPVRPGSGTPSGLSGDSTGTVGLVPVTSGGDSSLPPGGGTPSAIELSTPGGGDDGTAPTLGKTGDDTTLGSGGGSPTLSGGDGISDPSLSTKPVTDGGGDPANDLVEPKVATAPTGLSGPKAPGGDGFSASGGGDDDVDLPFTGVGAPKPDDGGKIDSDTGAIASIDKAKNQPPTISKRAPDTLSANQGKPLNVRLGEFFDEDGALNLELRIQGDVPNGLSIRMIDGGVAVMTGTPAEFGNYNIKVAAVDSEGLLSESITVALTVERPTENRDVSDYILGYQGGECFHSRPIKLGPELAQIEVFASRAHIPQVLTFDKEFKRDQGFEAKIVMHPISPEQCPIVGVLHQIGPEALDNSIVIRLIEDNLKAGDNLSGKLVGGRGARLFLYDDWAGITDLTRYVREVSGEVGFTVKIGAGVGPQILIAARPRDGSGLPADASLNQLLAAAQQGKASLALAYFVLK